MISFARGLGQLPSRNRLRLTIWIGLAICVGAGALLAGDRGGNPIVQSASPVSSVVASGGTLTFTAGSGENNNLTVSLASGNYTLSDPAAAMTPGTGCTAVNANSVSCSATGITSLSILGLDGNDTLKSTAATTATIDGGDGSDKLIGGTGTDSLIGGDGADTLDYSSATSAVTMNLATTTAQSTGGAGSDTVSEIENLTGSAYNDTLTGTTTDNVIAGLAGNDVINGDAGTDTLDYSAASAAVTVNLSTTSAQNTGGAGTDTVTNTENVVGSAYNDSITGASTANVLSGGNGNDYMQALAGDDTLDGGSGRDGISYAAASSAVTVNLATATSQNTGGAGTDTISSVENVFGSAHNDTLTGDSADNIFDGRAGNDAIDGAGGGADQVTYASAASGVTVDLGTTSAQNTGGGGTDTLTSVENITGTTFNDTLTGTSAINEIAGGDGNDVLQGLAGNDLLNGGAGSSDQVDYSAATAAVTVNLSTTSAQNTGGAGTDTITNAENVTGSAYNDSLTGNSAANTLAGGSGSDAINGVAGDDTLDGGANRDSIYYSSAPSAVTVNLATTTAQNTGGAGTDTISNVENVFGSPYNDTLTGDAADNIFDGRAGDDAIDGASGGADQVTYASATAAVTVDLGTTTAQNTDGAGTDTLTSVENVTGSAHNDTLTGTSAINEIYGGDGNDMLQGLAGNDYMDGGASTDTIRYTDSSSAVAVNLATTTAQNTSGAGTDTILNSESLVGSAFNDTLTGNSADNVIAGLDGDDSIDGGYGDDSIEGEGGEDNLIGGPGDDDVSGGFGSDVVDGGRGADTVLLGDGEIDTANCGSAVDSVVADPADSLRACDLMSLRAVPSLTDPLSGGDHYGDAVSIGFSLADASGFECSLDAAEYETCASPWALEDLDLGEHTIQVRATGLSTETELVPTESVVDSFVITDTAPPMPTDASVVWNDGGVLKLDGDPWDYFNVRVTESGSDLVFESEDHDGWWSGSPASLTAWTGCEEDTQFRISCDLTGVTALEIATGYRDDLIESDSLLPTTIDAGDGDDMVVSSAANDHVLGGDGADRIDYSTATVGVEVDLSDNAAQYTVGGGTDTLESVENLVGSNQADVLDGSTASNIISGLDGNDTITGSDGSDEMDGGAGDDDLDGGEGIGTLTGGDGDDTITGGSATDIVDAGNGVDEVSSGGGEDWIQASDASVDELVCGDEFDYDHVTSDQYDAVDSSCEDVTQPLGVHITSAPDPEVAIHRARATIEFITTTSATTECSVDDGEFAECESPYTTPYLLAGTHRVSVRSSTDPLTVSDAVEAEFSVEPGMTAELLDGVLHLNAAGGLDDELSLSESGSDLVIENESGPEDLGLVSDDSCEEVSASQSTCPLAEVEEVVVATNDGNDTIAVDISEITVVDAGSGDDSLTGGDRATALIGGAGSDAFSSTGDGPTVDYSNRTAALSLSLDATANDGEIGEEDDLLLTSGAIVGGAGDDEIVGDSSDNLINGGPGADQIEAEAGNDEIDSYDMTSDDIDCGLGTDTLRADLDDTKSGCETSPVQTTTLFTSGLSEGAVSADPDPVFEFENVAATDFECSLDDETPVACTSPWPLDGLIDGNHSVAVEAFDGSTSLDPTPARRHFTIDSGALSAFIYSPSDGDLTTATPTFDFFTFGAESVTCVVDEVETEDCESPFVVTGALDPGEHTIRLDGIDEDGFEREGLDEISFLVDESAAETEVEGVTDGETITGHDFFLTFVQPEESPLSFECSVDVGDFEDCDSPWSPPLESGEHTLTVRAITEAGSVDASPWTADITVDPSAPTAEITDAPSTDSPVRRDTVKIEFSGSRESGFECRLDNDTFEPCESPFQPSIDEDGPRTFSVRALKDDMPTSVRPATTEFETDDTPPTVIPSWGAEHEILSDQTPFDFDSSEEGSSFECGLVNYEIWNYAMSVPCESPWDWGIYASGEQSYRLSVTAIDAAGNRSGRVFHEFTYAESGPGSPDNVPPAFSVLTEFGSPASGYETFWVPDSTPKLIFDTSETSTFTCLIDDGEYEPCTSGGDLSELPDGEHVISVCAEDANENVGCIAPALSLVVDTGIPAVPELVAMPSENDPGDIATFEFAPISGAAVSARLDGGEWSVVSDAATFVSLSAGSHTFEYKAYDEAGNESEIGEYEWTANAAEDGPYYSLQLVSPDPGSSYIVWPTPGTAGSHPQAAQYKIRSCVRKASDDCSELGDPPTLGVWSDWDDYDAVEGRSDGITGSPLTPIAQMGTGEATVVKYEVRKVDSEGEAFDSPDVFTAGPWPMEADVEQLEDNSEESITEDEFVSEDEEIDLGIDLETATSGYGIKGIGLVCEGDIEYAGSGSYTEYPYPCAHPSEPVAGPNIVPLGLTLPTLLAFQSLSCSAEDDAFGTPVLTCPKEWQGALGFFTDALAEHSKFGPKVLLFVELSNGQLMIVKNLQIPKLDRTPPSAPEDLLVGGDAVDGESPPEVYVDWGATGDAFADDPESEASGITEFAIKYRVNGGTWSEEVLHDADEFWTWSAEDESVEADDTIEFSIVSVDAVGHRSQATTETGTVAALAEGEDGEAPVGSFASGITLADDAHGDPVIDMFSEWNSPGSRSYDSIVLTTELFDHNVDRSNPGPSIETRPKTCRSARYCSGRWSLDYAPGIYVTRTTIEATGSAPSVTRTYWSSPTEMFEVGPDFAEEEEPSADIDDTDSEELAEDENLAFIAGSRKMPRWAGRCWSDLDNPSKHFLTSDPEPWQEICRRGYRTTADGKRRKYNYKQGVYRSDRGVAKSYPPGLTSSQKHPLSVKDPKTAFNSTAERVKRTFPYIAPDGKKESVTAWPMFDSFGYTRGWLKSVKTKKVRTWDVYPVSNPADPYKVETKYSDESEGTNAKLQGKACYRPNPKLNSLKKENMKGLGPTFTGNQVSLFKLDFGGEEGRIRLFVENRAFSASGKKLRGTKVRCGSGGGNVKARARYDLLPTAIPGEEKYDFAFKEGPRGGNNDGKTYRTYNTKTRFNVVYAPANTNSVQRGGVARGVVPSQGTRFALLGFTGYCDKNSFTKNRVWARNKAGNIIVKDGRHEWISLFQKQQGMRWAYGQYITAAGELSGVYGWIPFSSIGLLSGETPDNGDKKLQACNYGATGPDLPDEATKYP